MTIASNDNALVADDAVMLHQSRSFERARIAQFIRERCSATDFMYSLHDIAHTNVLDEVFASDELIATISYIDEINDSMNFVYIVRDDEANCYVAFDTNYFFRVIARTIDKRQFVSYCVSDLTYRYDANLIALVQRLHTRHLN